MNKYPLKKELETLLNKHSAENGSDTPDYILAKYLIGCLNTFEDAIRSRDNWHGFNKKTYIVEGDPNGKRDD